MQVQTLQRDLKEKMAQLQQVEQMCRRQKLELDNRAAKFGELDQLMTGLKRKFEESREENLQLTQILRSARFSCSFRNHGILQISKHFKAQYLSVLTK